MGNCCSRRGPVTVGIDYLDAEHAFTETELNVLHLKLCEGSSDPTRRLKRDSAFGHLVGVGRVDSDLQERFVSAITNGRDSTTFQFMEYLISRAKLEAGGDDVESFCFSVVAGHPSLPDSSKKQPSVDDVRHVVTSCQKFFLGSRELSERDHAVVEALVASVPHTDGVVHQHDLAQFFKAVPAIKQLLRRLPCGIEALPRWCSDDEQLVLHHNLHPPRQPLLHEGAAWLLAFELLDPKCLQQWRLAYDTDSNPVSMAAFMATVADLGPSLLLVEAANGAVFGAFAADAWTSHGQFYGAAGYDSFVFSLHPQVAVYHSTGSSENFQWCCEGSSVCMNDGGGDGVNVLKALVECFISHRAHFAVPVTTGAKPADARQHSATSPNGLGLGGKERCQALFIDESFRHGHSVRSETYDNCCLAGTERFEILRLECWLVNPDETTGAATVKLTDLVLDKHERGLEQHHKELCPDFEDPLHRPTVAMSV